jgi:serine/threonine-protein kinase
MDLLEGESLAQVFAREKRLPLVDLATIMVDVVDAVAAARLDTATKKWALLGTPSYMAPEQVFGDEDLDCRADLWALGVILYEGLAGVRPTEGDSAAQIFMRIVSGSIEPLERCAPEVPADVTDLVGRMLSPDRDHRPADAEEVRRVLARYAAGPAQSLARSGARGGEVPREVHATRLRGADGSQPPLSMSTRPSAPASGRERAATAAREATPAPARAVAPANVATPPSPAPVPAAPKVASAPSPSSALPEPEPSGGVARQLDREIPWQRPRLDTTDPWRSPRDE